jgi:hypothetical protein
MDRALDATGKQGVLASLCTDVRRASGRWRRHTVISPCCKDMAKICTARTYSFEAGMLHARYNLDARPCAMVGELAHGISSRAQKWPAEF